MHPAGQAPWGAGPQTPAPHTGWGRLRLSSLHQYPPSPAPRPRLGFQGSRIMIYVPLDL